MQWIFALTIIVLVGGFSAIVHWGSYDRKSKAGNGQYDERQIAVRGKAFQWGFCTMLIVGFAIFLAETALDRPVMAAGEAPILMICCGGTVMAVYCIVKDAYVSINGSRGAVLASMGIVGVTQVSLAFDRLDEEGAVVDGKLGYCWIYFGFALLALSVFVSMLVKLLLERRRGE